MECTPRCFSSSFGAQGSRSLHTASAPANLSRAFWKCAWHSLVKPRTICLPILLLLAVVSGFPAPALAALDRTAVDRTHGQSKTARPPSLVDQVRFNGTALPFDDGVTAGPGSGYLEIQFASPQSVAQDRVHFRYRLRGWDTDWTDAGKDHEAIYTQLPPGRYMFELEEADGGNAWGQRTASLWIVLIPHVWQTALFWGMSAIILLVLTVIIFILRHRSLSEDTHDLQEEVQQKTAELLLAKKVADDASRAIKAQAMKDSLTDLWNRRVIFEMLEKEISRAQRENLPLVVVMIDLDHFKAVNDTYGHLTGDVVLEEAARRLAELMRPYDFAGRYGGEEFLIVLPGCSPSNGIRRAEDFRRAIADSPVPTACGALTVTCSLGVASHEKALLAEDLIHIADEALYRAKRLGRNCVAQGSAEPVADGAALDRTGPGSEEIREDRLAAASVDRGAAQRRR
jgi:diguanylate cyclase (GGDEF)-like protein